MSFRQSLETATRGLILKLSEINCGIVDVEATSDDPAVAEVLELSLVPYRRTGGVGYLDRNMAVQGRFAPPSGIVPPESSAVHHITIEDVAGLPSYVPTMILPPDENDIFVSHMATFDAGASKLAGKWICTYRMARKLWQRRLDNFGLQFLRYFLKLSIPDEFKGVSHSSLGDAVVCGMLLDYELNELAKEYPEIQTVEDLLDWLSKPILVYKMPFGKHKGMLCSDVPRGYWKWALQPNGITDADDDLLYTMRYYAQG